MSGWNGRKVKALVAYVVQRDGGVCWLCEDTGADSADHEPPRSELVRLGVLDPDDPIYLHASHLLCNKRRGTRPVEPALIVELKAKRAVDVARARAAAALSPILAARRPRSLTATTAQAGADLPLPPRGLQEKSHDERDRR